MNNIKLSTDTYNTFLTIYIDLHQEILEDIEHCKKELDALLHSEGGFHADLISTKNTILDHNISCDMDMLNEWDVSCYVWAEALYSGEKNLNTYSKVNGCNERTFLATQYFINGYPTKETEFNKDLGEIVHENIEYSFSSDYMHLYVNGREYKAPENWEDRKAQFNNVQEAFK